MSYIQPIDFLQKINEFRSNLEGFFQAESKTALNTSLNHLNRWLDEALSVATDEQIAGFYVELQSIYEELSSRLQSTVENNNLRAAEIISSCRSGIEALKKMIQKHELNSPVIKAEIESVESYNKAMNDMQRNQVFEHEARPTRADLDTFKRKITGKGAYIYVPSENHALYYLAKNSGFKKLAYKEADGKAVRFMLHEYCNETIPELQQAMFERFTRFVPKALSNHEKVQIEILLSGRARFIEVLNAASKLEQAQTEELQSGKIETASNDGTLSTIETASESGSHTESDVASIETAQVVSPSIAGCGGFHFFSRSNRGETRIDHSEEQFSGINPLCGQA